MVLHLFFVSFYQIICMNIQYITYKLPTIKTKKKYDYGVIIYLSNAIKKDKKFVLKNE